MIGAALCLGIGGCGEDFHLLGIGDCGEGVHLSRLSCIGVDNQDVPVLGVDSDLAIGGNDGL